ncbi:hypothetical protein [Streptomyces synnematoformans]|uniref:Uncharacterized protein n=1 Tax=Streptomyces synnematoformans TaxID=415721 RepID=A0ABN2XX31_9ACTN
MTAVVILAAVAVWLVALVAAAAIGYIAILAARRIDSACWNESTAGAVPDPRHGE